jgi:hypothetical protein
MIKHTRNIGTDMIAYCNETIQDFTINRCEYVDTTCYRHYQVSVSGSGDQTQLPHDRTQNLPPTLIPLSGVGTTCFSSCCDKDSAIIFMTGRLPDVNTP